MQIIENPIIPGFAPDPSIVRVGPDYYIATSTFEWWPGVQLHHSRDLAHWRMIGHALDRRSQLDMRGNANSGGVWAPCLTHCDGIFYLVYSNVRSWESQYDDLDNFLVTAPSIAGPWSDPVYLNSSGFDASLFHDSDGRKWIANMIWDHRSDRNCFGGIVLQEYSPQEERLIGPATNIFTGTNLKATEAPHLYKRGDYYYLLTAEGGTGWLHAVTMARSKSIDGPYEVDPENPILTARDNPGLYLQKAGHGDIVETPSGDWYMVHLCSRPLDRVACCPLGRETAIQKMVWTSDGWLRLAQGGRDPARFVPAPNPTSEPFEPQPERIRFDSAQWDARLSTLRVPTDPSWASLTDRPGRLRLVGRQSPASKHDQSLVARRLQSLHARVTTSIEFDPDHFQHMAGLVCFYDTDNHVYLRIARDESLGKCLGIVRTMRGVYTEPMGAGIALPESTPVHLRVTYTGDTFQFSYSLDGTQWTDIGCRFESSRLSDDYCGSDVCAHFTGTMIGICVQDLAGTRKHADFAYFEYLQLEPDRVGRDGQDSGRNFHAVPAPRAADAAQQGDEDEAPMRESILGAPS
jgi:xylan 1,4-beta-xylosidase